MQQKNYWKVPILSNTCKSCRFVISERNNELGSDTFCDKCLEEVESMLANETTLSHFKNFAIQFFNFEFRRSLAYFEYGVESLFDIGDYNPKTGRFYVKGYIKTRQ